MGEGEGTQDVSEGRIWGWWWLDRRLSVGRSVGDWQLGDRAKSGGDAVVSAGRWRALHIVVPCF